MKPRTVKETAIVCGAGVLALALLLIPFELSPNGARNPNGKALVWLVVAGVIALGMVLGSRYLMTRKGHSSSWPAASSTAGWPTSTVAWPIWPSPRRSTPTSS
jgi:hypothetical protein